MPQKQYKKAYGVSDAAVTKATGHDWDEWLSILDDAGAQDWDHKQIVAFLKDSHALSPWWQQSVTVAYEKADGRRVVGQTADSGWQVGVQKTLALSLEEAWALISSRDGLNCWLGKIPRFRLVEGKQFTTDSGVEGELRVVKPSNRVRLTWRPPDMGRPATLQIALRAVSEERTSVRVHLERLISQDWRERMKRHWKAVLLELEQLASRRR